MENGHLRVRKGKRIPKSTYCQLANTVGRESRAEVDVRSGRVNLDDGRIGTRMPEESLSDKQRTRKWRACNYRCPHVRSILEVQRQQRR